MIYKLIKKIRNMCKTRLKNNYARGQDPDSSRNKVYKTNRNYSNILWASWYKGAVMDESGREGWC